MSYALDTSPPKTAETYATIDLKGRIEFHKEYTVARFHTPDALQSFDEWLRARGYEVLSAGTSALSLAYRAPSLTSRRD